MQRVLDCKKHSRTTRGQQGDVAGEVNGVAQSLVCGDQDRLFLDAFLAEPHRLRKPRIFCRRQFRAGLVSAPAGFEIAGQEMGQRHIPLRHLIAQPERCHAIGQREQLVEAMQVEQRDQPVVEGIGKARLNLDGFFEPRQRLFVATKPS